ncbi:MAG: hypothetical protein A2020_03900 [Lentisphaerae bacterium GWF2_45_14]|nr:MAG: hypothetical protein A2020_03900 [Lentisphaerae bacterium GWF2_45_14]
MWFYISLVIITIALYYFYKRYKSTLSAKDSFAVQVLLLLMLVLFYFKVFSILMGSTPKSELLEKERSYMELAGKYSADYIRNYPWNASKRIKKVLIIDYPLDKKLPGSGMSDAIIKGIEKSLDSTSFKICAIERPYESADSSSAWLSPREFDMAIRKHPRTDFVISLVGLPRMLGSLSFWRKPNAPKLILIRGNVSRLESAFRQKAVIGAMVFIPGLNFKNAKILNTENEKEAENAFYQHFIFITPRNIRGVQNDFPELFWKK